MKNIWPIILIAISVGLFFFYIDPAYKEIQELGLQKQEYDTVLANAEEFQKKRDELRQKYNQFSPDEVEKLRKLLPDTVDNVRLILDIDNIATQHDIVIQNISIIQSESNNKQSSSRSTSAYGEIGVSFSFSASYSQFRSFLRDLEDSLRLVDITDITASKTKSTEGSGLNYTMSLKTYWLR